ncbi:MAG: peptide chain release factor 2 [Candidatus Bipolaricaulota bacterium]
MEDRLSTAWDRLRRLERRVNLDSLQATVAGIEREMADASFWDDRDQAQRKAQTLDAAKERLRLFSTLREELEEAEVLRRMAEEEEDEAAMAEAEGRLTELERKLDKATLQAFLSGPYDKGGCYLSFNAGAGGTDAQDWTEIMTRMYSRFCESQGWKVRLVDETPGEEAGLKSATLEVRGSYAFGTLRGETGVHRLVRISPYDSANRRHTSFASLTVIPMVEDKELEIDEDDLKFEAFRAGGPGGQHMQKNETAVRITHVPTGIIVACQNERSQAQNKLTAMRMLRARLFALMEKERARKLEELTGQLQDIEWGHQIRSYVLQPYQMVKDHRTGVETGNVQGVLDGDLGGFIWAWLEQSQSPETSS